jgi:hypothetical protein
MEKVRRRSMVGVCRSGGNVVLVQTNLLVAWRFQVLRARS